MIRSHDIPHNRWQLMPPASPDARQKLGHLHPVLVQLLYNRQLTQPSQIQAFLEGRYLLDDDPFLLPDMERAVARIKQALEEDEMIAVYGDFDADGVTSTVLLIEALRGLGASREQSRPYIPDRVDEGYGLNNDALTRLKEKGVSLVISVDCGIRAIEEVEHANRIGLDVIITDHHNLGAKLPDALAVVNPKRLESSYPERMLAGVGTAYKLAQALADAMPDRARRFDLTGLLDLVALGSVADMAPLLGENRLLVAGGLQVLNEFRRPGVAALAIAAGLKPGQKITAESIGFGLGPRINAAGRLAHAYKAAKLLSVGNRLEAGQLAKDLDQLNYQRQRLTHDLTQQAEALVDLDAPVLVAASPTFQPGVVGLVAGRLREKYYRPTIVLEQGDEESRGSCRSIPEFHMTDALDQLSHLLVRHGGHAQAAGLAVRNRDLAAFKEAIIAIAAEALAEQELRPTITVDAEVTLADVDWALYDLLEQFQPTGEANALPLFMTRGLRVHSHRAVGRNSNHLKLSLGDGAFEFNAIAFRQGAWAGHIPQLVDLVFTPSVNEWNGRRTLELKIEDLRPAEPGALGR